MELTINFLLILSAVLFFAAFIHGSIGFGFPMIATPLLALVYDLKTAILFVIIPNLLVNVVSIASEGDFFNSVKRFFPLVILTTIGSAIGTLILVHFASELFKLLLAFFILFYLFMHNLKLKTTWIKANPTGSMIGFGLASGIVGGLTNAMAPVLIIYALEMQFTKKETIQSGNLCFFFSKSTQLVLFTYFGAFGLVEVQASLIALLFVGVAILLGIKLKKRISQEMFKQVIKGLLFVIAMVLIFQVVF